MLRLPCINALTLAGLLLLAGLLCTPAQAEQKGGEGEGVTEGIFEGEGSAEGVAEGQSDGVVEGVLEGEGSAEGVTEGVAEGEGVTEGEGTIEGEGTPEGVIEGLVEGEGQADGEGVAEGVLEGLAEGVIEGEGLADGEGALDGEGLAEGEGAGEGEGIVEGEGGAEGEGEVEGESVDPLTEVIYVRPAREVEGELDRDGLSWESGFHTIQEGVDAAKSLGRPEVWVARGLYAVEPTDDGALQLAEGIAVYGGFRGDESTRSARDPNRYVTTIDGSTADAGEAAQHVVIGAEDSVLNGFTVRGGVGDGGGLLVQGVAMLVQDCIFRDNRASRFGGGILAAAGADLSVLDCVFRENIADINGGGISASNATLHLSSSLFYRNTSPGLGGGLYLGTGATAYLKSPRFTENTAAEGGALAASNSTLISIRGAWFGRNRATLLGGAAQFDSCPSVKVSNSVFSLNSSDVHGGAVDNQECSPFFLLNTFSGNSAAARGSVFYNEGQSQPRVRNCILANSTGVLLDNLDVSPGPVEYSLIEGTTTPGVGNLSGDPRFIDEANERYGLKPSSPCIDTGGSTASGLNGSETVDHVGNTRGFDGDGFGAISGDASEYDMGAFEAPFDGAVTDSREVPRLEHAGDSNSDFTFNLSEVLRVIQLYNAGSFGCAEDTENGYDPTSDETACDAHSSDYLGGDFIITLSELLRTLQLFNLAGYYLCPGFSEDDFCGV